MEDSSSTSYSVSLIIIGSSCSGKSSICCAIKGCDYNNQSTIGIDFVEFNTKKEGQDIKVKIWDTAGQERFHNLTNQYIRRADGILLCFDITYEKSLEQCSYWIRKIDNPNIPLVLMGNKCDLESEDKEQIREKAKKFAEEHGIEFFEVSSKTSNGILNIHKALNKCINEILKKEDDNTSFSLTHRDNKNKKKKKKFC